MEHLGYDTALFNHIIAGEDVPERKPSVMAYKHIVESSGLPAGETMYVGDRVAGDIVPAKSAGMQTVLVGSESDEADYSIEKITDINRVLK